MAACEPDPGRRRYDASSKQVTGRNGEQKRGSWLGFALQGRTIGKGLS